MKTSQSVERKRTQRDYTLAFKLSLVEMIEKGDMTYKQAQDMYGIQGRSTVLVWLRKHGKLDWSSKEPLPKMSKLKETPAQTIKRLEKALEEEKLRRMLLDEMVDYMDKEHETGIRKKLSSMGLKGFEKKKYSR